MTNSTRRLHSRLSQARTKQTRRGGIRRLLHESLEQRQLLAFDGASPLFSIDGDVTANQPAEVALRFTGGEDEAVLGFLVTSNGTLDPRALEVQTPAGVITSLRRFDDLDDPGQSFAVVRLPMGNVTDYGLRIGGQNATVGAFTIDVFLMGDLSGDGVVDDFELLSTTAAVAQSVGAGNLITQEFFRKNGIDYSADQRRPEMNSDLDNDVDGFDLIQVEINHGKRAIQIEVADGLSITQTFAHTDTNSNGRIDIGEPVTFTYTLTNTGSTQLTNVRVNDDFNGERPISDNDNDGSTNLAPGAVETATSTRIVTQADLDGGILNPNPVVRGKPENRPEITTGVGVDPINTPPLIDPSAVVNASFLLGDENGNGRADVGETITYNYTLRNTGDDPLSNMVLRDALQNNLILTDVAGDGIGVIAPGAIESASATITITAAQFAAGSLTNPVTVTGVPTIGTNVTATDSTQVSFIRTSISVVKTSALTTDVDSDGRIDVGDQVTYSYVVTNTGEVALANITVVDDLQGTIVIPQTTLAANESFSATSTPRTISASEFAVGSLSNTVTASGVPASGSAVTGTDSLTINFVNPAITVSSTVALTNDVNQNGRADAGDQISYSHLITNSGDLSVSGLTVTDSFGSVAGSVAALQPSATTTRTQVHTITAAEITAGNVANTVNVSATPTQGTAISNTASVNFALISPAITVAKTVALTTDNNSNGQPDAGDQFTNTYTIQNTGDSSLSNLSLQDTLVTGNISVAATPLAAGATRTATATQTVTAADVTAQILNGTVTVTGQPTIGNNVTSSIPTQVDFSTFTLAAITVDKSFTLTNDVDGDGRIDAGDQVTFAYLITNSGQDALSGITLIDGTQGAIALTQTTLASGVNFTATSAPQTITAAQFASGSLVTTAAVTGSPEPGRTVTGNDSLTINFINPAITVSSTVAITSDVNQNGRADVGDQITYSHLITNSGDLSVSGLTVTDSFGSVAGSVSALQPSAATTRSQVHTVTAAEIAAGNVANTVNVSATPTQGTAISSTASVNFALISPAITVAKTVLLTTDNNSNGQPDAGDQFTNTYTIQNTGDSSLSNLSLQDTLVTGNISVAVTPLAAGATRTATATQTVTAADVTAQILNGTVTVTGQPTIGNNVTSSIPTQVDFSTFTLAAITVDKSFTLTNDVDGDGRIDAGDQVTFAYLITNSGQDALSGITLIDGTQGAIALTQTTLASGANFTATSAPQTITAAQFASGSLVTTAAVTGSPEPGRTVTGNDSLTINFINPAITVSSSVALSNDVNQNGRADSGDQLTYTYVIQNTGDTVLTQVAATDNFGAVAITSATLQPGATTTQNQVHVVTLPEFNTGSLVNNVNVTGTPTVGTAVTAAASATTNFTSPNISVLKSFTLTTDLNNNNRPDAGDTITNSYLINNLGDTTLTSITLQDTFVAGSIPVLPSMLASGANVTVTAPQVITAADIAAGVLQGMTTVTGTPPEGDVVTDAQPFTLNLSAPGISITQEVTLINDVAGNGVFDVGDDLQFRYTVTNAGGFDLSGVTVTDSLPNDVTLGDTNGDGPGNLAAGDSEVAQFTYRILASDLAAGGIFNTVTATGTPAGAADVTDQNVAIIPVGNVAVTVTKTSALFNDVDNDGRVDLGDTVRYTFTVQNTGAVTLNNVALNDNLFGNIAMIDDAAGDGVTVLGAGLLQVGTFDRMITQADVNAGRIDNIASVTAISPAQVSVNDTDAHTLSLRTGNRVEQTIVILDASGAPKTGPLAVGENFQLEFRFEDLNPQLATTATLGAFTDLLINSNSVTVNGIAYSSEYPNDRQPLNATAVAGGTFFADLGATDGTRIAPAQNTLVFTLQLTANAIGDVSFITSPSDNILFSVGVFGEDGRFNDQTLHRGLDVSIVAAGGEPLAYLDVNGNGHITSLDALMVINHLNEFGNAEGEFVASTNGLDVTGDGYVSALDALTIINYLNAQNDESRASAEPTDRDDYFASLGRSSSLSDDERFDDQIGLLF